MFVYILESTSNKKHFYVGCTADVEMRLKKHNAGEVPHSKKYRPWILKNYFWFDDESRALQFEKYLKSGSGRAFSKKHF